VSFDVDIFVDNPSKTELYSLTKHQLKLVVECEPNTKKAELCQAILDCFVKKDLIPEEQPPTSKSELEIRRLELKHRTNEPQRDQECQLKMKELELREKELEMKDKQMQLQLKLKELELQKVATPTTRPEPPSTTSISFDVRKSANMASTTIYGTTNGQSHFENLKK